MLAWRLTHTGDPRHVLESVTLPPPKPRRNQLAIDVQFAGASFADLLLIRGEYQVSLPLPCVPGSEMVGVVREAGPETNIAPGTRVLGLANPPTGAFASTCLAIEDQCEPIPDDLPGAEAVALVGNYVTAHLALVRRARVRAGETVVVYGAAGGVGSAAVQIAKALGATVIGADLGGDRAALCKEFGADMAVDATDPAEMTHFVREATGGRGADVVIDPVGGQLFEAARRFVAYEGRVVVVGFTSGSIPNLRVNHLILKTFAVLGVNALTALEDYPEVHREARQAVVRLLASGAVKPAIGGIYPFDRLPDAFADMADKKVSGKAVVLIPSTPHEEAR